MERECQLLVDWRPRPRMGARPGAGRLVAERGGAAADPDSSSTGNECISRDFCVLVPLGSGSSGPWPLLLTLTHEEQGHAVLTWVTGVCDREAEDVAGP